MLLATLSYGCYQSKCDSIIKIEDIVLYNANQAGISYCKLVNEALAGDSEAIKELFCQHPSYLDGESSYLHSFYVYKITQELGEVKLISVMKSFDSKELMYYYSNLEFGMQQESLDQTVKDTFPKLYDSLWNGENPINSQNK